MTRALLNSTWHQNATALKEEVSPELLDAQFLETALLRTSTQGLNCKAMGLQLPFAPTLPSPQRPLHSQCSTDSALTWGRKLETRYTKAIFPSVSSTSDSADHNFLELLFSSSYDLCSPGSLPPTSPAPSVTFSTFFHIQAPHATEMPGWCPGPLLFTDMHEGDPQSRQLWNQTLDQTWYQH
jgi:hypothetical protein